jgi:hypothetical protein
MAIDVVFPRLNSYKFLLYISSSLILLIYLKDLMFSTYYGIFDTKISSLLSGA